MKHNKKKNIAIIFDILLLEQAKSKMSDDIAKYNEIESLLNKHFNKSSILLKEYSYYNILTTIHINQDKYKANKILSEVKSLYKELDKNKLNNSLNLLKEDINKIFDKNFYENFVNNYKLYATIYNILNECESNVENRILLEEKILNIMLLEDKSKSEDYLLDTDTVNYNKQYSKFIEKTSELLPEQNKFLNYYIKTYTNDFDFFVYLNEEVNRCKKIIIENNSKFENRESYNIIVEKIEKIPKKLKLDKQDLNFILEIQLLANKINE